MKYLVISLLSLVPFFTYTQKFEQDVFPVGEDELAITFIGHGSLMFEYKGDVIHIDPSSREADYYKLSKADLVLITHHHGDHADPVAYGQVRKDGTTLIQTQLAKEKLGDGIVLNNGEKTMYKNIEIEAIPAYNLVHKRNNGEFFHPKGCCNSYLLNIGELRIFIGGDTENTPEMKGLKAIDIAFLPMNLPYTMTPEMVAAAAKAFRPKILYPYHYGSTNVDDLLELMEEEGGIEIRVRKMK
ncbi:MBL fold metallo-hydrolase [Fulvivirga sp. M361]|nr:MBL fold metallo-hydrolase [Fulvivirga sp. M361]